MKTRSDSALAELTETQRDQLYDWLSTHSYAEVIDLAAKPEADGGLNLNFHKTTLVRFFNKEQQNRHAQELAELSLSSPEDSASSVPSVVNNPAATVVQLIAAAKAQLAHATYELAKAASEPQNFDRLERALHHLEMATQKREQIEIKKKELALEEQRLALERERLAELKRQWEFNVAREVMKRNHEYNKIHQ